MTIKLNKIQLTLLVLLIFFYTTYIIFSYFIIDYLSNEIDHNLEEIAKFLIVEEVDSNTIVLEDSSKEYSFAFAKTIIIISGLIVLVGLLIKLKHN